MHTVKEIGGARVGYLNATWPFASLQVTQTKLTLSIKFFGKMVFQPSDIVSIKRYSKSPFGGKGIQISHTVDSYKKNIIFWTLGDPQNLIEEINKTGFLDSDVQSGNDTSEEIRSMQKKSGFPLKLSFSITMIILWNLLFFIDTKALFNDFVIVFKFGEGYMLARSVFLLISILLLISPAFQKLALKEGREIREINGLIYLIITIIAAISLFDIILS